MAKTPVGNHGDKEIACLKCGTAIPLHGLHWCAEVCPECLKTYEYGFGADYGLYEGIGFYPHDMQPGIRANIAKHGGRYRPHFSHSDPLQCGTTCA